MTKFETIPEISGNLYGEAKKTKDVWVLITRIQGKCHARKDQTLSNL
jgi:hypothetical protein